MRCLVQSLSIIVLSGMSAARLLAGDLTPPAGPVAPTMKSLTDVEPRTAINATNTPGNLSNTYVISQSGSYYLSGNVSVPSGRNGILVSASHVTIDLNGFSIQGVAGSLDGITSNGTASITVKNGTVATCGGTGVNLINCASCQVTDVSLYGDHYGLQIGNSSRVTNCRVANSSQVGITSAGGGLFDHCTVFWSGVGFSSQNSDVFESCIAQANNNIGFNITSDTKLTNCQSIGNSAQGIVCQDDNWISNCQVHSNGGANMAGIWVKGVYNHVEGNEVVNNGYGIYVGGATNFIYRNKVGSSTQSNFYIIAGNHVGTIGVASTTAGLINGNSGGGLGALESDANANLIY